MKVAMICHFSNQEIRDQLPLSKKRLYIFLRRIFGLPNKATLYGDTAIWDTGIINAMKTRDDINLYVLSCHSGLRRSLVSFEKDGVHFTFFRHEIATMLKHIVKIPNLWLKLNPLSKRIAKTVNRIKPDIVLLCGAENPHYASSVLRLSGLPVYLLCQVVYNSPTMKFNRQNDPINEAVELSILQKVNYAGVYCEKHFKELKQLGYHGSIFGFHWPSINIITNINLNVEKKYDFIIFAASLSEGKGFHDSIRALSIVKKKYPGVQLNIVDSGPDKVKQELLELINQFDLTDNVSFTPYFERLEDLFQHIVHSRFGVLPSKVDNISGTMLQCMNYGIPIVVYETQGTPSFNQEKQCVQIANLGDIEDLASKMVELMDCPELASTLSRNSIEYRVAQLEKGKGNIEVIVQQMRAIVDNYNNSTQIPQQYLFENKQL